MDMISLDSGAEWLYNNSIQRCLGWFNPLLFEIPMVVISHGVFFVQANNINGRWITLDALETPAHFQLAYGQILMKYVKTHI